MYSRIISIWNHNSLLIFLQVVDGSRTKGCSAQTGWGKLCAVSLDNFNGIAGSACPGDSGSPLVTFDNRNGGWTLIGLLSNGAKSCFKGLPEVYTRVGDYLDWIHETIRLNRVPWFLFIYLPIFYYIVIFVDYFWCGGGATDREIFWLYLHTWYLKKTKLTINKVMKRWDTFAVQSKKLDWSSFC